MVCGFDLPDLDFFERRRGAPGIGIEPARFLPIQIRSDHRLTSIDEDFDEVFVDEDA